MNSKRKDYTCLDAIPLYSFFHENTKIYDLFTAASSSRETHYKSYPRFEEIQLTSNLQKRDNALIETIEDLGQLSSLERKPISLEEISTLLFYSAGIISGKKKKERSFFLRSYPSLAGAYPLELYLIIFESDQITPGIFHYNVKKNVLETLLKGDFTNKLVTATNQEEIRNASLAILISAIFHVAEVEEGDRGYRYVLLEAGHLSQNIRLVSAFLNLESRSTARFLDAELNRLLDLDGVGEAVLFAIFMGRKKRKDTLGKRVSRLFR